MEHFLLPVRTVDICLAPAIGLRMFATHKIRIGEIILMEHPVLILADCIQLPTESSCLELKAAPSKVLEESMPVSKTPSRRRNVVTHTDTLANDILLKVIDWREKTWRV